MIMAAEDELSEDAIDALEATIPALAVAATRAAYVRAMLTGLPVLAVEGTNIVARSADGTTRIVGEVPPRRKVQIGKAITVCRVGIKP